MFVFMALGIVLGMLVFVDQRMNGRSGIGWAVFVAATSIFGFLFYIFYSRDTLQVSAKRLKDRIFIEQISSEVYVPKETEVDKSEKSLPPMTLVEPGFVDDKLELYIKYKDYKQARAYIENVLKVAKEREDDETPRKYEGYIDRINELDWSDEDWLPGARPDNAEGAGNNPY